MANLELAQPQFPKVLNSLQNSSANASVVYASGQIFSFVVRLAWLVLLLTLLITASLVWIWLYSFRSGWQFWDWVYKSETSESMAPNLIYGLIILLVSPFILFAEWSQQVIQQWFNLSLPLKINLRQIVESQIGTKLGDNFPFLREDVSENK